MRCTTRFRLPLLTRIPVLLYHVKQAGKIKGYAFILMYEHDITYTRRISVREEFSIMVKKYILLCIYFKSSHLETNDIDEIEILRRYNGKIH